MATYADAIFHSIELTSSEFKSGDVVTKSYVDTTVTSAINAVVDGAPAAMDTLREISTHITAGSSAADAILSSLTTESTTREAADVAQTSALSDHVAYFTDTKDWLARRVLALEDNRTIDVVHNQAQSDWLLGQSAIHIGEESVLRIAVEDALGARIQSEQDSRVETDTGLQYQVDQKLAVSTEYQKRDDGALQVTYLYISDVWRLGASTGVSSKRLQFEFFDGTVWGVCVPFVRPV